MISQPRAVPCSKMRYSLIQATKWSLKVPLISWCSKSGVRSSWMSARGNSNVKGCKVVKGRPELNNLSYRKIGRRTTMSLRNPKSSHRIPGSKVLIKNSVFWCERRRVSSASRSSGCPSHLTGRRLLRAEPKEEMGTYFGHQPWTIAANQTCSG